MLWGHSIAKSCLRSALIVRKTRVHCFMVKRRAQPIIAIKELVCIEAFSRGEFVRLRGHRCWSVDRLFFHFILSINEILQISKEDDQAGNDAPLPRTGDSSVGDREAPVGDAGFKAPKRPRTAAQIATFEKARAKRAENLAKKVGKKPAPEPEPEPTPPHAPEPVATPAPAPRPKPRSDAGKRRDRLVRYEEENEEEGEPEVSSAPPPPFFVIV